MAGHQGFKKIGNLTILNETMRSAKSSHQKRSKTSPSPSSTTTPTGKEEAKPTSTGQGHGKTGVATSVGTGVQLVQLSKQQIQSVLKDGPGSPPQWTTIYPNLPHSVTIEQVDTALAVFTLSCQPCDIKVAAVHLERTLELYGVPDNWDEVAGFYLEAIADLPEDMLVKTLKQLRLTSKWFPKPSEIRAAIPMEFRDRVNAKFSLRTMKRRLR